jgi:transposase
LKIREKFLAFSGWTDSVARMIQLGFLTKEGRDKLIALAWDGSAAHRLAALVLLNEGGSCEQAAHALLLDGDTIRGGRRLFEQRGIEGLTSFDESGSASYLTAKQEDNLTAWVGAPLPRSTRQIGAFIKKEFSHVYESHSGLIALSHRLGLEYHKPDVIPRKLDKAIIDEFTTLPADPRS